MPSLSHPFSINNKACFLHGSPSSTMVIMCAAEGYEEICTRSGWRIIADRIAEIGFGVVRFDYLDCGDSADTGPERNFDQAVRDTREIVAWVSSIGVERVILLGLRWGALVAARVASTEECVDLAILVAPVPSGRMYARELKLFASVSGVSSQQAGEIVHGGFYYSPEALQAIGSSDLSDDLKNIASLLVFSDDDGIGRMLRSSSPSLKHVQLSFPEQSSFVKDGGTVPTQFIDALLGWLRTHAPAVNLRTLAVEPATLASAGVSGQHFKEACHRFGSDMLGVLCRPASKDTVIVCILFNQGGNYHVGWARLYVEVARKLAERGIASFRVDFPGVGESGQTIIGGHDFLYYDGNSAFADEAIEYVSSLGFRSVVTAGNCSGAYWAFRSALKNDRVKSFVAFHLYAFEWGSSKTVWAKTTHRSRTFHEIVDGFISGRFYRKLATGQMTIPLLGSVIRRQVTKGLTRLLGPWVDKEHLVPTVARSRSLVRVLAERGVPMTFVFGETDPSLAEIEQVVGLHWLQQQPLVTCEVMSHVDHELSNRAGRETFLNRLSQACFATEQPALNAAKDASRGSSVKDPAMIDALPVSALKRRN